MFKVKFLMLLVICNILITGCTSVQLISNYDENIDKQAQALQKKLDTYFISMKNLQGKSTNYVENQKFYEEVLADINSLETRAAIIYKNEITQQQVVSLKDNFAYLVFLHKQCFDQKRLNDDQRKKVRELGVDLSLDCKIEYGAPKELKNRGDKELKKVFINPVQRIFNSHLGAIMKLEFSKKRGNDNKEP